MKRTIYEESSKYAQQKKPPDDYLKKHQARAHDLKRHPIKPEEIDTLLATIIIIGMMGFPRLR